MRRGTIIMYVALVLLSCFAGRTAGWQTGDVTLVRVVGLDLCEAGVRLSAAVEDGAGSRVLTADGTSVADAVYRLRGQGSGKVHLGHADQLILGQEFLTKRAPELLDFVAREVQIGPGGRLWAVREGTAAQALECGGQTGLTARLEQLTGELEGAVTRLDCTVTRLMSVMARQGSVCLPTLQLEKDEALRPAGYAVLRNGALVGFLNWEQSLGAELLRGQGAGQRVELDLEDEERLNIGLTRVEVQYVPRVEADRPLGLELNCRISAEVVQAGGRLTRAQMQWLAREAELVLCDRVTAVLACAQFWDADFVELERRARSVCSEQEWEDGWTWKEGFRGMPLRVSVQVEVDWPTDIQGENAHEWWAKP